MNDPKRQEIKDRIAASQVRNDHRGSSSSGSYDHGSDETQNGFVAFVTEHPLLTVGAGVAAGVLIAGMFPSARGVARKGGARASALGAAGAQILVGALEHAMEAAEEAGRTGGDKLGDLGDVIGETARSARREASSLADRTSESARIAAHDTGKIASRSLSRLWK